MGGNFGPKIAIEPLDESITSSKSEIAPEDSCLKVVFFLWGTGVLLPWAIKLLKIIFRAIVLNTFDFMEDNVSDWI